MQNQPIPFAQISVKSENAIIAYSTANDEGKYEIKLGNSGKFIATFSAINYDTVSIGIEAHSGEIVEENANLNFKPIELNEIIINPERQISQKKDTIIYNAKSFMIGNEKVVEDLLKKIPGITITDNGTIKVGNQEVEKVMIDGQDFFEKGYKLLTKNMPANPVDKIELYKHYSNNKQLKGIEHSDRVALNLRLKDDAKREWFGNMQLGYGIASENRYESHSNLMNFGKNAKYYFLGNFNNIGDDPTAELDQLIRPYRIDEPASIGDNQSGPSIIKLNNDLPDLKQRRVNFNNAEMVSLNGIFSLSEKVRLKALAFFDSDNNPFFKSSFQSYTIQNIHFENIERTTGKIAKIIAFAKINLTYDLSDTKMVEYSWRFNTINQKGNNNLTFNGILTSEQIKTTPQLLDHKIVLTNRLAKDKVLLITGRYIYEKNPQMYSSGLFLYQSLFSANAANIAQSVENKMQFAGFESHLINRRKNGHLFELQLGDQYRKDDLISIFQLKSNDAIITEPLGYQNQMVYSSNDLYLTSKYRFTINRFNLIAQSDFHQLHNELCDFGGSKKQAPFFINPKIGVDWQINNKHKLSAMYSFSKANATIHNVFTNYINTGFRSFQKGTGNFNQLEELLVKINHTYGNWSKRVFITSTIDYAKNHNYFTTSAIVIQNYSLSEKVIVKNKQTLNFYTSADWYIKPIGSNLKITMESTTAQYKSIVNLSEIMVTDFMLNYGVELRSGFKGFLNYHVGLKKNYTEIKTSVSNSYYNTISFLDLYFRINDKLNFQLQTERYIFGNENNQNNRYYFTDFQMDYSIRKDKLVFSLVGNNLFDIQLFKDYSITDIAISKTEYRLQPRYGMLKVEFRY